MVSVTHQILNNNIVDQTIGDMDPMDCKLQWVHHFSFPKRHVPMYFASVMYLLYNISTLIHERLYCLPTNCVPYTQ